jgi:hypothetical protein
MTKAILFLVHTLGLGDLLSFSPIFLFAFKEGYSVDIAYEVGNPGPLATLLFNGEKDRLRFLRPRTVLSKKTDYRITVLGDRRCLGTVIALGTRAGTLLPIPIQARRKSERLLYDNLVIPSLRLFGVPSQKVLPNPGERVGRLVFRQFCKELGKTGSLAELAGDVRRRLARATGSKPEIRGAILVHLFRNLDYKLLGDEKLSLIAKCLGEEFPGCSVVLLFNGPWEKERAEYFSSACQRFSIRCKLLSPPLKDIIPLSASARLYLGVDHGVSHLASLFCRRSVVIYGGSTRMSDIHLLWPPQLDGQVKQYSENLSLIKGKARLAVLLHPSAGQYLSSARNPTLINRIVTYDTVRMALRLATARERK